MNLQKFSAARLALILLLTLGLSAAANAQQAKAAVLSGAELQRVVPTGFYFEGQSAPTQMRNAAAARLSEKRRVIAGMVDTSGYSSDIRAKYEGFLIVDAPVSIGGETLGTGAYGFGFTDNGKLNVFDVGGNQMLSVATANDKDLRRPRPLALVGGSDGLRFYSGRSYAVISAK